jgi:hypothetical protein
VQVYAVSDIPSGTGGYKSTWAYREYFHGAAGAVVNRYGERPYTPLPLIRNVRLMPEVFFAGISLVVGAGVADRLSRFDSVDLNSCEWESVYDQPIDEQGVQSMYQRFSAIGEDYGQWLETQLTPLIANVLSNRYFEVIVPRLEILAPRFPRHVQFELASPIYQKLPPLWTCAALHRIYPVVKVSPHYLFETAAFEVIEPFVRERELFTVQCIDISEQEM